MTDRISFKAAVTDLANKKINSDLTNLAQALIYVEDNIKSQQELKAKIEALAAKIEAGELVDVSEVSSLYRQAQPTKNF